jgi:GT2 family glycosyltransferase
MARHRRSVDRGSDEIDRRQYENCEFVFAASGAALMIRRQALPDLSVNGEVFDEDFFAYHEETDLAWRAQLLGWKSLYVPDARALHQRGWRRDQRFGIDPRIRRHAFKNRYLEMVKNERPMTFLRDLPAIAGWELLRLGYSVTRDRTLLHAYREALRLLPRAWAKRRIIQQRAASLR